MWNSKLGLVTLMVLIAMSAAADMSIVLARSPGENGTQDVYRLSCAGALGTVSYGIQGLPQGAKLVGDTLVITGNIQQGNYILRIRAVDSNGQVAEKIVSLEIGSNQNSQTASHSSTAFIETNSSLTSTASSSSKSSSNGTAISTSSQSRLGQIINQYSTIVDVTDTVYTGNSYPEVSFPTGGDATGVNTQATSISTSQATASSGNRNQITADEVALRAASERHQNAVKAITNLLAIIDQARANVNQALLDIDKYNKSYLSAQATQRKTQDVIISFQIKIKQISSAIDGIGQQLDANNAKINDLKTQRVLLVNKIAEIQNNITLETANSAKIKADLAVINQQLAEKRDQLTSIKTACDEVKSQVAGTEAQVAALDEKIRKLIVDIGNALLVVQQKESLVKSLENQLAAAKDDLNVAQNNVNNLSAQRASLESEKNSWSTKLVALKSQYSSCSIDIQNINNFISQSKASELQAQLTVSTSRIQQLQQDMSASSAQITQIDASLTALQSQVARNSDDIAFLKGQLTKAQEDLRKAYIAGNDANTLVLQAKQNLDAANQRYLKESATVATATQNLEKARSEEALARLALEETIAYYSDALPYAIVPNGNGQTNAGSPAGNNPSGSPLGEVNKTGNGAPGSFVVNDWTHYLSQAYGAGVNPAFSGSVTVLYPFSFSSVVSGNTVINGDSQATSNTTSGNMRGSVTSTTSSCTGTLVQSVTGVVTEVGADYFIIKTNDGKTIRINIAPCTSLTANQPNYAINIGDIAVVKGPTKASNQMTGQSVTCLS